jgi:hypothetical protein
MLWAAHVGTEFQVKVDPLQDDGLPLVNVPSPVKRDGQSGPAVALRLRPLALNFETKLEDDPTFVRMSADDVSYTPVTKQYCYPPYCTVYMTVVRDDQ